jgi:cobalt-zinc-cadmium efflux system outer membrane protein
MNPWLSFLAGLLAGGTILNAAAAPAAPPPAGLGPAVQAAWQRAVAARESDARRQRAQAEQTVAQSWAAGSPSVEFGYRDDRWQTNIGNREGEIGLIWPLWLPGQRAASGKAATAAVDFAAAAEQAARLRVAGDVADTYWACRAQEADLAAVEAQVAALQELAADVDRRVRAGDLARADALAARAEVLEATARQADAAQQLAAARLRWTDLTGLAALPTVAVPQDAAAAAGGRGDIDQHPELAAAHLGAEQARARLELARSARRDAPELLVGLRQEVPERGAATQNSALIGVRIPLGTAARNAPLDAAALGELEVAQLAAQRTRERLAAELEIARQALSAAARQLAAERERAALLRERASLIERAFRAGEAPLPDTLRALAAAAQAEAALARQSAALGLAHARLQHALGVFP